MLKAIYVREENRRGVKRQRSNGDLVDHEESPKKMSKFTAILYSLCLADIPFESGVTVNERGGGVRFNHNGPEICKMAFPTCLVSNCSEYIFQSS